MTSKNSKGLGEIGAAIQAFFSRADIAAERVLTAMAEVYADLHEQAEVFRDLKRVTADGWTISTFGVIAARDAHREAAAADDLSEASRLLEETWSDPELRRLMCSLVRYVYPADERAIADRRRTFLLRACDRYEDGLYAEAVLLVYSQLDGIFQDRADEDGDEAFRRLFSRKPVGKELREFIDIVNESDTMIGIEPDFFLAAREAMTSRVDATTLDDGASRHGVLHCRILGYDSRRRAAQAFAFLAGCMEILVSSREKTPMTREEAHGTAFLDADPALQFIVRLPFHSPVRSVYMTGGTSATNRFLLAFEETEKSAVERAVDELKAKRESRTDD
jgi:hypothetical protein